jgi:predicted transcriptional regulator
MRSDAEKKAVDILMSPCKIFIVDNIAKNENVEVEMIRAEMEKELPKMYSHLEDHLNELIHAHVIRANENRYALTSQGKKVYNEMKEIAGEVEIPA